MNKTEIKKLEEMKNAAKIKVEEAKTNKETRKSTGVGAWVIEKLKNNEFEGLTNKQIAEIAKEKFESNTKASCIGWYKNKIKKDEK